MTTLTWLGVLAVRSTIVAGLGVGLAALLRRRCAEARHLICAVTLAALALLPITVLSVPAWEVAILPERAAIPEPSAAGAQPVSVVAPGPRPAASPALERSEASDSSGAAPPSLAARGLSHLGPFALTVYLLGVVSVLLWTALGHQFVHRLVRRSRAPDTTTDREWLDLLNQLSPSRGRASAPELRFSSSCPVAIATGLRRATILLPESSRGWEPERRREVLLHELAHVERRDNATQLLARLACALHWFHPLAWLAAARLAREAEHACDDAVLRAGCSPTRYADTLLGVARELRRVSPSGLPREALPHEATAMARAPQLGHRISNVLDATLGRSRMKRTHVLTTLAVSCLVFGALATLTPVRATGTLPVQEEDASVDVRVRVRVDLTSVLGSLSPLQRAAATGDGAEAARLIGAGADVDEIAERIGTPLVFAASRGDGRIVQALLEAGADPNLATPPNGSLLVNLPRTALTAAARGGHGEVVELLLAAGADVEAAPPGDETALMAAAARGHRAVARQLIAAGADTHRVIPGDPSALMGAAASGDVELVALILDHGADPDQVAPGDGSPLIAAARSRRIEAARLLLDAGADPDLWVAGDESPLLHALENGDVAMAELLLDYGADPNASWPGDGTPLIVASRTRSDELIDLLVRAGADVDAGIQGDGNALINAAREGNRSMVERLLAQGADVDAAVEGDGSALIAAASRGELAIVETLLAYGASIDQVVPGDENALIQAAGFGHLDVVRALLDQGADVDAAVTVTDWSTGRLVERTALSMARQGGHDDVVELLLARGATR